MQRFAIQLSPGRATLRKQLRIVVGPNAHIIIAGVRAVGTVQPPTASELKSRLDLGNQHIAVSGTAELNDGKTQAVVCIQVSTPQS